MVEERKKVATKIEKQYNEIKNVCCNYFDRYDRELGSMSKILTDNKDKYENWVEKFIEPSTFNDARLFALETRFNEEEEMRF